jgi:hypothetical protein
MARPPDKRPPVETGEPKRSFRTRSLREVVAGLTRGPFRKQGFAQTEILNRWAEIVGGTLADVTAPERVQFQRGGGATLVVRTEGSFAPELQHLAPLVIERINAHFGFRAVARITIVHGPLPIRPRAKPAKPAPLGEPPAVLAAPIDRTRDPALAAALKALARRIAQPK